MKENKNYDVVREDGTLLFRGFACLFFSNNLHVQMQKIGPFGSGVSVVEVSQLRPFNSVKDGEVHKPARTALW